MVKTMLYVEPGAGGWQIVSRGHVLASHHAKQDAIELATRMARNRHEVLGECSGVVYSICSGERVCLEFPAAA